MHRAFRTYGSGLVGRHDVHFVGLVQGVKRQERGALVHKLELGLNEGSRGGRFGDLVDGEEAGAEEPCFDLVCELKALDGCDGVDVFFAVRLGGRPGQVEFDIHKHLRS